MAEVAPVALLAIGFGYQLWRLRRDPGNPVLRCLAIMFGVLVVAVGIGRSVPYLAFDDAVGVANLARLVQHVCAMTAFCVVQILLLYVARPAAQARPAVRPRAALLVVVVLAMTVLFGLARVDVEAPTDFVDRYGSAAWVGPYLLLYLGYLGIGVVDVIVSCTRHARRSVSRPWLRMSFWFLVVAGSIGLAYVLAKGAFTVAAWRGLPLPGPFEENSTSAVLVSLGAVVAAVGVLLPTVGARIEAGRAWRMHRRLLPLWTDVTSVVPRVVLSDVGPADVGWRRYRRVVEIQDALLDLRYYGHPRAAEQARESAANSGLAGDDLRAVVEAAGIAAAVRAKRSGQAPSDDEEPTPLTAGADDMSAWLVRVAEAYATSAHVSSGLVRAQGAE